MRAPGRMECLCQAPIRGPQQVLDYLGRYTHRVAIANSRLLACENGRVHFRWRDYRADNQSKVMTLEADEFSRSTSRTLRIDNLSAGIGNPRCWLQGSRSVDSVDGNAVQAALTRCPQSSECCPLSVGSRVRLASDSARFYAGNSQAPKTLLDWARQAALQIRRWLPDRSIILVADSAFAAIEFHAAVRKHVRHRLAARCQSVRFAATKAQTPRPAADQGQAVEKALRHPQRSQGLLAALPRQSLVRPNQPHRRHRQRNRALVSRRRAAGADPLASRS